MAFHAAATTPPTREKVEAAVDVMSHLTVSMVTDVLDGQVLDLRSSSRAEPQLLRLGNTAVNEKKAAWKQQLWGRLKL